MSEFFDLVTYTIKLLFYLSVPLMLIWFAVKNL